MQNELLKAIPLILKALENNRDILIKTTSSGLKIQAVEYKKIEIIGGGQGVKR